MWTLNGLRIIYAQGFGVQKLGQVLKAFPDLNREWLLFGEGEMLNNAQHASYIQNVEQKNSQGNISVDSNLAHVVAEQTRQISRLIEMVDRLTQGDDE